MCGPLAEVLRSVTCYDLMGSSTQVVVVEETAPLTIPFVAAQESMVSTCFAWSSVDKDFTGLLTVTEYLKILLYCEDHPEEVERISTMTVKEWLVSNKRSSGEPKRGPLVSVSPDDTIAKCLKTMLQSSIRRLPVVADDVRENQAPSILCVLGFPSILDHLVARLFSVDVSGEGGEGLLEGTASTGAVEEGSPVPASVQNMLGPLSDENLDAIFNHEGPYPSVFDVPFMHLKGLGRLNKVFTATGSYPTPQFVTFDSQLCDAFKQLLDNQIQAVPVVDPTSLAVVDVLSRNDVVRMESGGVFNLRVNVREAVSFRQNRANNHGVQKSTIAVFTKNDTLRDIMLHFASFHVKILFLVDATSDALLGQLSLSEVLAFIYEQSSQGASSTHSA